MTVYYDLHIHSCLSPCASDDMTPNNILNMSLLKELDLIALTDHNSARNCPALLQAAEGTGITVIPGMELTTAEEIHMVCLFETLDGAMQFDSYVHGRLAQVANRPEIFGRQMIMDAQDQPCSEEPLLLVNATSIGIEEVPGLVRQFGGLCYPAHIDRSSYSVLSNLGMIPEECGFRAVEVADPRAFFTNGMHNDIKSTYDVITSSDAHYLEDISEREHALALQAANFKGLAEKLL